MACPTSEQLELLARGKLAPADAAELQAHLTRCSRCRDALEDCRPSPATETTLAQVLAQVEEFDRRPLPKSFPGYELIREIHRGGQGVVYEAFQKATKRIVAVKFLHEGPFAGPHDRARFEREVEILGRLNHPNIVAIHDSGMHQGSFYYVMDYVQGVRLHDYVRERRPAIQQVLDLLATVCEAVGYAHERGVIHRDLKPPNILVVCDNGGIKRPRDRGTEGFVAGALSPSVPRPLGPSNPHPMILDFGLAKASLLSHLPGGGASGGGPSQANAAPELMTVSGQLLGTLPYMAPEQARGRVGQLDARTDVYALGVILYQLLTGHYPYPVAGELSEVLHHIKETEPVPPSQKWTAESGVARRSSRLGRSGSCPIDRDVQTIVLKALAKEPERRYQSVSDMACDLRRYLAGEPIAARGDSLGYVLSKKLKRNRVRVAVAAVLVLAIAAVALFYGRARHTARLAVRERAQRLLSESRLDSHQYPERALEKLSEAIAIAPGFLDAKVDRAFLLKRERKYSEALVAGEALLRDHPQSGEAHLLLSLLAAQRDPQMAAMHRARARELLPDDRFLRAAALEPDQAKEAVELLTAAIDENRQNFEARRERAWRLFNLHEYEAVLLDTEILITIESEVSASWNLRGLAMSGLNRTAEAIEAYGKAIAAAQDYAPTYLNRATAYINQERFGDAVRDCDRALQLEAEFADAYALRANALCGLRQPRRALIDAAYALELKPRSALAFRARGYALKTEGDLAGSVEAFERSAALDPSSAPVHLEHGDVLRAMNQHASATEAYSRVIALAPTHAKALAARGICYLRLGCLGAAEADFDRALALDDGFAGAYLQRVRHAWLRGAYSESVADADRAVQLEPNLPEPCLMRAMARWMTGDLKQAAQDLEWVIREAPSKSLAARIWFWEIADPEAFGRGTPAAGDGVQPADSNLASTWNDQVLAGFLGRIAPESFIMLADSPERLCEAYYYVGLKALVDENSGIATWRFLQCLDTGALGVHEYYLARWRLESVMPGSSLSPFYSQARSHPTPSS